MKKQVRIFTALALSFLAFSCTSDNDSINLGEIDNNNAQQTQEIKFPEADNSIELSGLYGDRLYALLAKFGSNLKNDLWKITITEQEYNEIKQYTDELVAGCTTDMERYAKIYADVRTVEYAYGVSLEPYQVFKTRKGLCQGYADLLSVMLHTQNILGITCNGWYCPDYSGQPYGYGHAWNYVYCEGTWYTCDPTNSNSYSTKSSDTGSYKHLVPTSIDTDFYEDENFAYTFYQGHLSIRKIKASDMPAVVPYSIEGYKVTSIFPISWNMNEVPQNVEISELYIGKNIQTLSNNENYISLPIYTNISAVHIDPAHPTFESFSGAIYQKNNDGNYAMLYVAPAVTFLELKAVEAFDKESKLKNLPKVETIVFAEGTKNIDSYAIENCPNLHKAYVPTSTEVADHAFYNVASDFQLIRGEYTNIPQIKE